MTKSSEEAVSLKEKGNACFKEKKISEALIFYTNAIFCAPWPQCAQRKRAVSCLPCSDTLYSTTCAQDSSQQWILAICLSNHSAALFELGKYKECLNDIRLALKLGVNSSIEQKLLKRQHNCQTQLKDGKQNVSNSQELCLHNVLESKFVKMKSSKDCGRFLEATDDIPAGTVIAIEEPFASLLDTQYKLSHCSYCFTETASIIPCYWCTTEGYCSEQCLERAWSRYHWLECERASQLQRMGTHAQLCLRTAVQYSSKDYQTVFSLVTHKEQLLKDSSQRKDFEKIADALTNMFGQFLTDGPLPPMELLIHHLLQLRCNSHTVSRITSFSSSSEQKSGSNADKFGSNVSGSGSSVEGTFEAKLGSVLYPTLSLINHSCLPNAILRFSGNKASLCATRLIRAGEEINISYGPQAGRASRDKRRMELRNNYFFDCGCNACIEDSFEAQEALLCSKCLSGALVRCNDSTAYTCVGCKYSTSAVEIANILEMKEEASRLYQKAINYEPYDLSLLLECHRLQTQVLCRDNMELAKTNDSLAQVYAMEGDFVASARYCGWSCGAVSMAYGESSVELGQELIKLAQLFFNSGSYTEALKTATRARHIIKVHYGTHHSDYQELDSLIKALQK